MLLSIYVGQIALIMHRDRDTQTHRTSHLLTCAAGDLKCPQTSVNLIRSHFKRVTDLAAEILESNAFQSLNIDSGPKAVLYLRVLKEQIISDFNWIIRQARSARCKCVNPSRNLLLSLRAASV